MTPKNKKLEMSYLQIAFCTFGYHHTNGKKGQYKKGMTVEGTISQFCKGSDIISNMYDTKLGKVCLYCYKSVPKKYRFD